jgi:hypothetical protein
MGQHFFSFHESRGTKTAGFWSASGTMKNRMGVGPAIGVGTGTALGAALGNISTWVVIEQRWVPSSGQ